ncbi:MAG: ABC transporter permease, partial [Phocaeicola sp.]|nr:ABC transporter permease [Phocaeicola sp.]
MKVFRKTGVSTLINILGMSVAFASAMILMVQVRWDTTYDANFEGHKQVFRVENNWMDKGLFSTSFSRPMIEIAKTASPNIEAVGTYWTMPHEVTLKKDGEQTILSVPSARVDSSMFSVFPFEWVEGSAREFTANETAVVSEEYAKAFFGDESAIGKNFKAGNGVEVRVIGVFKDMPKNSNMHYGVLVNLGDEFLDNTNEWSFL